MDRRVIVRNVTAQYVEHSERSPKLEEQLWQALDALAQVFESCYAAFAREISDPVPRNKWVALLPELLARQVLHFFRDAKLRLYRCERWSPSSGERHRCCCSTKWPHTSTQSVARHCLPAWKGEDRSG